MIIITSFDHVIHPWRPRVDHRAGGKLGREDDNGRGGGGGEKGEGPLRHRFPPAPVSHPLRGYTLSSVL